MQKPKNSSRKSLIRREGRAGRRKDGNVSLCISLGNILSKIIKDKNVVNREREEQPATSLPVFIEMR